MKKETESTDLSKSIMQACLPISKAFVAFGYEKGGSREKYFLAVHDTEQELVALNELGASIGPWLQMGKRFKEIKKTSVSEQDSGSVTQ